MRGFLSVEQRLAFAATAVVVIVLWVMTRGQYSALDAPTHGLPDITQKLMAQFVAAIFDPGERVGRSRCPLHGRATGDRASFTLIPNDEEAPASFSFPPAAAG